MKKINQLFVLIFCLIVSVNVASLNEVHERKLRLIFNKLEHENTNIRKGALTQLVKMKIDLWAMPEIREKLYSLLQNSDFEMREHVIKNLVGIAGSFPNHQLLPIHEGIYNELINILNGQVPAMQELVARVVGDIGWVRDPQIYRILVRFTAWSKSPSLQGSAIYALGKSGIGSDAVYKILMDLIKKGDMFYHIPVIAAQAMSNLNNALGENKPSYDVYYIELARLMGYKNMSQRLQEAIVETLISSRTSNTKVHQILREYLHHSSREMRTGAAKVLHALGVQDMLVEEILPFSSKRPPSTVATHGYKKRVAKTTETELAIPSCENPFL